jgi:CMP-N,N'-diacetyllegionaminic acid synthase
MYKDKKILAIIPARSGSKGLPNKNIKLLQGKHLIGYTIEAAKNSNIFDNIIVSTDSKEYADISKSYGAEVPFLRETYLSNDTATTEEVIVDVIEKMKEQGNEYDYFVVLQPTSPLRQCEDIINSIDMAIDQDLTSVVSVCEMEHSIRICNKLPPNKSLEGFIGKGDDKRRQDAETYYRLNGAIYIGKVYDYIKNRDFYGTNSKAYIMDLIHSVDIDNELDFKIAEVIIEERKHFNDFF